MTGVSETIHASCVSIEGRGVLLSGKSGAGKSDLALRLMDRGARLVSDDYTIVTRAGDKLVASAPPTIAGQIEVRGVGIVAVDASAQVDVALLIDLDGEAERMPEPASRLVGGIATPFVTLSPYEASAPIKAELALARFGAPR